MKVETTALSIKHIAQMYCVNGKHFADIYRNKISGYADWCEQELGCGFYFNAANIGPYMSLDETCLSNGEVWTFLTNKDGHGGKGTLATIGDEAPLAPFSVTPDAWGDFLCRIFDRWIVGDVGKVFIQLFDATLANHVGVPPSVCSMARTCGHAVVLEHNGDLYSCDHFVFPQYRLGNIRSKTIFEMLNSDRQLRFGQDKHDLLPRQCLACRYLDLCNGECPKNRFARTADGQPGLNYLCRGYRRFFEHSYPAMTFMKAELIGNMMKA